MSLMEYCFLMSPLTNFLLKILLTWTAFILCRCLEINILSSLAFSVLNLESYERLSKRQSVNQIFGSRIVSKVIV